jgi:hypothetical protein
MNKKERKDNEDQIEKDRVQHERDFCSLSKIGKCPKCGGEFDEGYIAILKSTWSESRFGWAYLGLKKPLTRPGRVNPSQFPALRCKKCHLVTFDYTSEVERGTVRE